LFNARNSVSCPLSMVICTILLTTVATIGLSANEHCTELETLVAKVHSGLLKTPSAVADSAIPLMSTEPESCAAAPTLSGATDHYCVWRFEYRTAEAYGVFNNLNRSFQECFGDGARVRSDQKVNHPDFYDLRRFEVDPVHVAVSIKDKSAMQSTYVFVRVHELRPD